VSSPFAQLVRGDLPAAAADARAMLDLAEAVQEQSTLHAAARLLAARTFAWAGEGDRAVELLERLAVDVPGLPPGIIARQPWYTVPLRDNPRFQALLAQLEARRPRRSSSDAVSTGLLNQRA
jgi:hypothetical protein